MLYGNAKMGMGDGGDGLAADIDLVATGVAKDASSDQLEQFLLGRGIQVTEIEILTTFEHARTNTFRVRIKASDYEKAQLAENWPRRVGVRHYRQPRRTDNGGWLAQSQGSAPARHSEPSQTLLQAQQRVQQGLQGTASQLGQNSQGLPQPLVQGSQLTPGQPGSNGSVYGSPLSEVSQNI